MDTTWSRTPGEPVPQAPPRSLRLLLVEDDPTSQRLTRSLLQHRGHEVTVAGTGREALDLAGRQSFDLVLLDVQLPDQDGYNVARELREREGSGPRTPILALTAGAGEAVRARCLAAGMDGHLTKPWDCQDLSDALERATTPGQTRTTHRHPPKEEGGSRQLPESRTGDAFFEERGALCRVGGDRVFLREMVEVFLEGLAERLARVRQAWQRGEAASLEREAHQLKGHLGQFSRRVAERAAELEKSTRAGNPGQQQPAWENLHEEIEQLVKELRVWADQEGGDFAGGGAGADSGSGVPESRGQKP